MIERIFLLFSIQMMGVMSPGPDFFLIFKNSLSYNRKNILGNILGITSGCLIHTSVIILSLELIERILPQLFETMRYLGAGYLIYLGISSLLPDIKNIRKKFSRILLNKNNDQPATELEDSPDKSPKHSQFNRQSGGVNFHFAYFEGLFCNLLNPKVIIFFLGVFSQFITPETIWQEKISYLIVIVGSAFCWFYTLNRILTLTGVKERLAVWQGYISRILAIILILLGLNLFFLAKY